MITPNWRHVFEGSFSIGLKRLSPLTKDGTHFPPPPAPVEFGEGQSTHGQARCEAQNGQNEPHALSGLSSHGQEIELFLVVCVSILICIYIRMFVCLYVCIWVCMYVCMFVVSVAFFAQPL